MKITTTITIEEDLLKKIDIKAEGETRTRSNMINRIIEESVRDVVLPEHVESVK